MKKIILLLSVVFVFGFAMPSYASYITVQKGDSLWKIAKKYNVDFQSVLRLNKLDNPDMIYPNQKIQIPEGTSTNTHTHSEQDLIESGNKTVPEHSVKTQAQAVLLLVNQERNKQGLNPLKLSDNLNSVADLKSKDMATKNYFSHTSPTYGTPFEMLQSYGIRYRSAGENIAAGQKTANEVMNAWMNSSGHRANILNRSYTEIGIGYYVGGSYGTYWTQLFVGN